MPTAHTDFYSIPELYDILHAPGTGTDVRLLRRLAARYATPAKPGAAGRRNVPPPVWLEPACGSARLLRLAAAKHGIRGIGFDIEPRMIRYASAAARDAKLKPAPRFFVANMDSFGTTIDSGIRKSRRLPKVDLAFNLINTIRHVNSDAAMLRHFRAVADVLKPTGVYVVGLHLSHYGIDQPVEDIWSGKRGKTLVTQVVQYLPALGPRGEASRAERVISHLTVTKGGEVEDIDSTYALRAYNLDQWTKLINNSALEVQAITNGQGKVTLPYDGNYCLFVLRPR